MEKSTYYIITGIIILLVLGGVLFFAKGKLTGSTIAIPGKYDTFADCLTEKGVKMYGAFWCGHCQNQKEMFAESFQYVNYIECSTPDGKSQSAQCETEGITGYPTWEFGDKRRVSGELSFEQLSLYSGCALD
ncbi:MAG: thioredoxin domain-containing protein [Nanoarchaeota archaeon]